MCLSPVTIDNPNYGKKFTPGDVFSLKDCTSHKLRVPCGHCSECIANKQMQLVQRVQMESINNYIFFCTLTYNNESLPEITCSSGFSIKYADVHDLQNMFKRLRKYNRLGRKIRYLAVSERGSEFGRPHFHILFFVPKLDSDNDFTPFNIEQLMFDWILSEWKRNYGSTRKPVYKPLCTYKCRYRRGRRISNYDLHFVVSLPDDISGSNCAFYVLKYMLKPSDKDTRLQQALKLNLPDDEYNDIWNLVRSRLVCSKGFGINPDEDFNPDPSIVEYIRGCVKTSLSEDFPKYYNKDSGLSFPLARYYKSRSDFYSFDDALHHYFNSKDQSNLDSVAKYDDKDWSQLLKAVSDYEKKVFQVSDRGEHDNYSDLFD